MIINGADLDIQDSIGRQIQTQQDITNVNWDLSFRTPLHIAIERNSVELAYIMIQSGANPDITDIIGR